MKISLLLLLASLVAAFLQTGCLVQTNNSVAGDQSAFAPSTHNGSALFTQSSKILKTNCATCHSDFGTNSESDFVSQGLIVPKNPLGSKLYRKLKNSNAGGSPGDMPKDGAPLSSEDLQTLRSWIESAGEVTPAPSPIPTTAFGKVQVILANKCVTCHSEFKKWDENTFVAQGIVVPGNADQSRIYYKLIGTSVSGKNPDMPVQGDPLTSDEIQSMRQWIDNLNPANFPLPLPQADTPFTRAKTVLSDSCVFCHKSYSIMTESDFLYKKLVTPGNAMTSVLFGKLAGSGVQGTNADMPKEGAHLLPDQIQTLRAWIEQIPAVVPSPTPSHSPSPSPSQDGASLNAAARSAAALKVITIGCADCHGEETQTAKSTAFSGKAVPRFGVFATDADFIASGMILPGDASNSWMIRSLKTFGDISSMPLDDSGITASDAQILKDWITRMGQP